VKEGCPVWPGHPVTAHWGLPDPAAVEGTEDEIRRAFRHAFLMLDQRIALFLDLPLSSINSLALKNKLDDIGLR
jgi:arsenate reductase